MKTILFPTDFSDTANNAFLYALRFADSFGAELLIMHSYDLPIVDTPTMPDTAAEIYDIVELNQFESFREELPEMRQLAESKGLGHINTRNILLYGDLVYNINKVCADENVDLIVMGTKGATGFKETFLGSATGSTVANAKVPVLAIPAEATYNPIDNIIFTTQYKDKDSDALQKALEIADKFRAKVNCLYIRNSDDPIDIDERINEWKAYHRSPNIAFHTIAGDDIEQSLLDFVQERHADLVVMRKHKRGFFEGLFHTSLTKKMAYHSKVPLLVFQEE